MTGGNKRECLGEWMEVLIAFVLPENNLCSKTIADKTIADCTRFATQIVFRRTAPSSNLEKIIEGFFGGE